MYAACSDYVVFLLLARSGESTEMVHGRARAPPRQTWRVAVDEGRLRVVSDWRPPSFIFHETAFSKRDVITYS